MTRKTNHKAVIYCRVSTKRQAKEGNGLTSQETRCREYAHGRGHEVIEVFNDDVSGKLASRPGFDAMLRFIRKNRKAEIVVIIDDVSRMARDVRNHFDLKEMIYAAGASLESPSWEFGTDPDSIFHENLMASLAQHQRQKNGLQAKERMRARMLGGYYVHSAPLGFRYEKHPNGGSTLVRDEPVASVIAEALESYACGRLGSKAEVKRFLETHPQFPRTRHGHVTNEQANRILTYCVYAGYVESECWGVSLRKGYHDGLISLETFQRIQERLNGKPFAPVRSDIHADFPLRGVIACGDCSHPMTANWTKGRTASYPYYVCRHRGCERFGKSVKREIVEGAYEGLLTQLVPSKEMFDAFSTVFRKRWDEGGRKTKERRAAIKLEMAAAEKAISQLVERVMASQSQTVISRYEEEIEKLERKKLVLTEKTAKCGTALPGYDESFRTAFEFLANPCELWKNGTYEDKRIVLKLTLDANLEYDWNQGVRTPVLSLPFKALGVSRGDEMVLADRVGFEPTVSLHPRRFSRPVP
ncbi:putative recombinase [Caenibius tardaugens NBRC 16725]|uniref:Putative recombinase n=1 Tax=Caenibius tardaugens NBRC 16725 TaxID=1219035 RepID=U3A015_9SPHN|nr:putative recombinase [Caenibius tardaugens NBRC 16725]